MRVHFLQSIKWMEESNSHHFEYITWSWPVVNRLSNRMFHLYPASGYTGYSRKVRTLHCQLPKLQITIPMILSHLAINHKTKQTQIHTCNLQISDWTHLFTITHNLINNLDKYTDFNTSQMWASVSSCVQEWALSAFLSRSKRCGGWLHISQTNSLNTPWLVQ